MNELQLSALAHYKVTIDRQMLEKMERGFPVRVLLQDGKWLELWPRTSAAAEPATIAPT